jgi:hypothetical protein
MKKAERMRYIVRIPTQGVWVHQMTLSQTRGRSRPQETMAMARDATTVQAAGAPW